MIGKVLVINLVKQKHFPCATHKHLFQSTSHVCCGIFATDYKWIMHIDIFIILCPLLILFYVQCIGHF